MCKSNVFTKNLSVAANHSICLGCKSERERERAQKSGLTLVGCDVSLRVRQCICVYRIGVYTVYTIPVYVCVECQIHERNHTISVATHWYHPYILNPAFLLYEPYDVSINTSERENIIRYDAIWVKILRSPHIVR